MCGDEEEEIEEDQRIIKIDPNEQNKEMKKDFKQFEI